jgi:ATPase subunit of ABC transporter with duplicated ATPase domains
MDASPVEYLHSQFSDFTPQEIRGMLGRFGLTGQTHIRKISTLSGGQKSRVVFAEICMRWPHILFLDGIFLLYCLSELLRTYQPFGYRICRRIS